MRLRFGDGIVGAGMISLVRFWTHYWTDETTALSEADAAALQG